VAAHGLIADELALSVMPADVQALSVNASNFMAHSTALMINADYPSILRRKSDPSWQEWSFFPRPETLETLNSGFAQT
jgi:hypothetical protein